MYETSGSQETISNEAVSVAALRAQAERCRRHARAICDDMASKALKALAEEYDSKAAALDLRQ